MSTATITPEVETLVAAEAVETPVEHVDTPAEEITTETQGETKAETEEKPENKTETKAPAISEEVKSARATIAEMVEELSTQLSEEGKQKLAALSKTFTALEKQAQKAQTIEKELGIVKAAHKSLHDSN